MRKGYFLAALFSLILFMSINSSALLIPEDDLYYKIVVPGDDYADINYSTTTEDKVHIQFSLMWDNYTGDNYMDEIKFTIKYPSLKFEYSNWEKTGNWNGNIMSTPDININVLSGYTEVTFRLVDGTSADTPPADYRHVANVYLHALCQSEDNEENIYFLEQNNVNYVKLYDDNNEYAPEEENYDASSAVTHITDFTASYDIADNVTAYVGGDVKVTVKATTDFKIWGWNHVIDYDNAKLQFDSVTVASGILPYGCFSYSSGHCPDDASAANGEVTIDIWNTSEYPPPNTHYYYTSELTDADFYYVWFTVISSANDFTTNLSFDYAKCTTYVYDSTPVCAAISLEVSSSGDYTSGSVTVPKYEAGLWIKYKSFDDQTNYITYEVLMNNCFPVGNASGCAVELVYEIPEYLEWIDADDCQGDIGFHDNGDEEGDDGKQYGSVTQTSGWRDTTAADYSRTAESNYKCLFEIEALYNEGNLDVTYDDRFIAPNFAKSYSVSSQVQAQSTVYDTACSWVLRDPSDFWLYPKYDTMTTGYEAPMAEFCNVTNSSGTPYVTSDIYIRNSCDLDSFKVVIDVDGSGWCIDCIYQLYSGCQAVEVEDDIYEIHWTSATDFSAPQNTDDSTKIGRVVFGVPEPCTGTNYYNITPDISGYAEDSDSDSKPVATREYQVTGKCYNGHGCGGAAVQSPCPLGPPPKKDITASDLLPTEFALNANRPNPFNPTTYISYEVPYPANVTITVYNIMGQHVKTLVDEFMPAGRHEVIWNSDDNYGNRVASGVYLYRMEAGDFRATKKMMLMK